MVLGVLQNLTEDSIILNVFDESLILEASSFPFLSEFSLEHSFKG